METLTCGQHKEVKNEAKDRITELPEDVVKQILGRAPLQDAVRTSALSRNWRYKWRSLNRILFDQSFVEQMRLKKNDFIRIVFDVLLNTDVPIAIFQLYIAAKNGPSEEVVDSWIHYLSKNEVKALYLENQSLAIYNYKLPSHFYSCVQLVDLSLFGFHFKPPYTFQGFPNLRELDFQHVSFDAESFARFVTSCPLLKFLHLGVSGGTKTISICSGSLRTLIVFGEIKSISINAQGLESLEVVPKCPMTCSGTELEESVTIMTLGKKLPNMKRLCLGGHTLKFLACGDVPHKYTTRMDILTNLKLDLLDFEDQAEMSVALCIIRSSPFLQNLEIKANWSASFVEKSVGFSLGVNILLGNLKFVELDEIRGIKAELDLVKCLLACSPSLEKMIIKVKPMAAAGGTNSDFYQIMVALMRFSRVSPKAEIHFSKSS